MTVTTDPTKTGAPRLRTVSKEMAKWLRARRTTLGWSQEQVVTELAALGFHLSRAHYANLERGDNEMRAEYVAVLDRVLGGDGELVALADTKWDRALVLAQHSDWVQVAQHLESSLLEDGPPVSVLDAEHVRTWWDAQAQDDPIVVEGREQVEEIVAALLSLAADDKFPQVKPPIEFTGAFVGFRRDGDAGLPLRVRQTLRSAMEGGWKCLHHIPVQAEHRSDRTLVRVASPLIACSNFEARIVDPSHTSSVENILIIPGIAAIQFFSTSTTQQINVAVVHRGNETARILAERVRQLHARSDPFVERFERNSIADPNTNNDEIRFRRLLADVAEIEGPCGLLLGWFPTSTVPVEDYADSVKRRHQDQEGLSIKDGLEMIRLQERRVHLLEKHLEKGHSFQVIISPDLLARFARGKADNAWKYATPKEMLSRLDRVLELMDYPSFEVAIATQRLTSRIPSCSWEVREGASDGVVVIQTQYTPVRADRSPGSLQRVDIKIGAAGAVRAFMAYFSELWLGSRHDQATVRAELEEAKASLKVVAARPSGAG